MSDIIEKLKHPLPLPAVLTVGESNRNDTVDHFNVSQASENTTSSPEDSVQASEDETKTLETQESDVEKTPHEQGPTHPSSPGELSEFPPFEYTAPLDPT
jgi:hypothetical protein